jgi:hypothetical protein
MYARLLDLPQRKRNQDRVGENLVGGRHAARHMSEKPGQLTDDELREWTNRVRGAAPDKVPAQETRRTPSEDEHRTKWHASLTRWLWMGGSGVATLVGAGLALSLFPSAAFGRNPVGQFGYRRCGGPSRCPQRLGRVRQFLPVR